ncbi:inactivated superfamily I helicase [Roseinatronobacter thiooxidans]|uniref:Inactivated superfamily I helicase n=1 Tax=Roseinatronobacter thiooxidans TaxID=121821 RepID=A0A2W7RVZ6_9RHOB|nr:PD-(D/E)XK nuclease family protein [Roseinatronobacter thiooxidans]PZX42332.1 inactivated superfamily I helicase [Roseinatronobacter thiooxidans]
MFQDDPRPAHLFALPSGVDFPQALAAGLNQRLAPLPPEARARVTLLVNSARMRTRVRDAFVAQGPGLLPRIRLITAPLLFEGASLLPPPMPPLRRRLELAQLIDKLLRSAPDLAPRSAIYDLADSLARLFAEMQAEGVPAQALRDLDVSRHSGHWARSLSFITLAEQVVQSDAPDAEGRIRAQAEALIARWQAHPPADPVIIAGSTGSRGTTALLMQAVAQLPQGAVVLPGFDFDMSAATWAELSSGAAPEDHPQYRFLALCDALNLPPAQVRAWHDTPAPAPARNRLVSLALRPAPVTDQWMQDGPQLQGIAEGCAGMTLIEAPSPRMEAQAIALRLRHAAQAGQRAALITPDRDLTRQVSAALDYWRITPDDSAGRPLAMSAPGRFLRHVAALMRNKLDGQALLTLLKHPLTHSAGERGAHLLHTRDLELRIRRKNVAFPDADFLRGFGAYAKCPDWAEWLITTLPPMPDPAAKPLSDHVTAHLALAEALAGGPQGGTGELWRAAAGEQAHRAMHDLAREASHGGALNPADYDAFITSYLQGFEVREPVTAHPGIMIWGTLEARVQGADLVILAGLNEGVWPKAPDPDPWLNRRMRADAGLLLPERQIGLAAHDFQQAIAVREVILSRAVRNSEAQTVPSRWLNRLTNLLDGLPDEGKAALKGMRARGQAWLDMAQAFDTDFRTIPPDMRRAPRPAPAPPVSARPRQLPVTAINRLIRDPYETYAKYVLGLRKLNPLHPSPDALLRGTVLHKVLEDFTRAELESDPFAQLMRMAEQVLAREVPWPAARLFWQARMTRAADAFLQFHLAQPGRVLMLEEGGALALNDPAFTLTAKPDRIDEWPDGRIHIIDYKTGQAPTKKMQEHFDKQLLLQAMMADAGAFQALGLREVAQITYLGLGSSPKPEMTEITPQMIEQTRAQFEKLIRAYLSPDKGFPARRMLLHERDVSDYDHLSRFGEWVMQDAPVVVPVGDKDAV